MYKQMDCLSSFCGVYVSVMLFVMFDSGGKI